MITAQDIGALAMMEKIKRIWLPEGLPTESMKAELDGSWYKDFYEKLIARYLTENSPAHMKNEAKREAHLRLMYKFSDDSYFRFRADRGDNTCFAYTERFNLWQFYSAEPFPTDDEEPGNKFYGYIGCLSFDDEYGLYVAGRWEKPELAYSDAKRAQFAARWLTFFRRNCWLCGCSIECSRQERLEWLQGLTHEEIEAWQLKV